ncbi:unnamed protein product [Discosporangium mesarthrocarpum]
MSRTDISNPVRALPRYSQDPSKTHWHQGIMTVRYLRGTRTWGINYRRGIGLELLACADSSYAGGTNDRRSVSGGAIMFGGGAVSWFSRTQKTVAQSSSEAEYVAMGECVKELLFVRNALYFMQPMYGIPSVYVLEDKKGAIDLAKNPLSSGKTKHIEVGHHFIRNLVADKEIAIFHVSSKH